MLMKLTSHKSNINKAMHYCNDKAIANDTFNMFSYGTDTTNDKINEMQELANNNVYDSRKYYHLILSPTEKENEPQQLLDYARELLNNKFNNCQATISIHNDNGRNHCHIILNATKIDGYKIDIRNKEYDTIKEYAQVELAKKYNYEPTKTKNERTNDKKKMIDYQKHSQREIIKNSFLNCYNQVSSIEELKEKLKKEYHIEIQEYKTKDNITKFSYKSDFFKSGISEDKLGQNFSREMISRVYEMKKEKQQENIQAHQEQKPQETKQDIFDILNRQAEEREERKIKEEKEKKLKELTDKLYKQLKDNGLDTKDNIKLIKDTLNNKELKLDIKIDKITSFIGQVAKIIKDMATEQVKQQTKSNDDYSYGR